MEASKKLATELIRVFEDNYCIRVKFESAGESNPSASGLQAVFVLDKSGSMAGGPIRDAKGALVSFISKMEKLTVPMTIIAFNNTFEEANSKTLGYEGLRNWAEKIKGSGGTLFKNVFECMREKFVKEKMDNTFVMFLSDGQDNDGLPKLIPFMEKFKDTIVKNNLTSSIHTIGFSDDHDAKLLTAITTYGTKAGTFQYLARDGRIPVAVNNATEFLYQTSMWGQYLGANKVVSKLEITDDENNPKIHFGMVFMRENDLGEGKVEIFYKGEKTEYILDMQRTDKLELEDTVHVFTSFISNTVLSILDKRTQKLLKQDEALLWAEKIGKIDKQLDEIIADIKKQRSLQRKQMMPFCLQAKDLISEFYAILKTNVAEDISNIKLAQLNRLAYQNILQRSLLKKINKRVGENAGMLQEIDQEINKILTGMNFKDIQEKYKNELESYGHCLISYKDWFDALQDGDCFCLTFDAERAEGGIMDPSLVVIKAINTTQLTAESFLDSALFITRAGQIIKGVGQHGAPASSLVNGLPEEVITGVMPLYINEEHWKVARLRLKPLLAWTIAQDVLAYEPKQLIVLPFLLLAKAAIDQGSEHKQKQFKLILDTCSAIYRDCKELILPDLKSKCAEYLTKPEVRTADVIPNNRVFLLHLYVASQAGDIDSKQVLSILPYVMEEEIRRNGPKLDVDINEFYKKLLDVDEAAYVVPYIKAFVDEINKDFEGKAAGKGESFKLMLKEKNIEIKEEQKVPAGGAEETKGAVPKPKEEEKILVDTTKMGERASKLIERYNQLLTKAEWNVAQTAGLCNLFGIKPYNTIQEMGIDTPAKQQAFAIQTMTQKVNADRREAIQKGLFVNSFDEAAAVEFVRKKYVETVTMERNNQKSKIIADRQKTSASASAPQFAATKDLYEAAGLLHGILRGTMNFHEMHKALRTPHCPEVIQKIKMLSTGQFMGIKLIMDEMKNPKELSNGFVTWKATKKHAYKIWKENKGDYPLAQWIEAFPHLAEYLDGQEKRSQGVFVAYRHPRANCVDPRHRANSKKPLAAKVSKPHKKKKK